MKALYVLLVIIVVAITAYNLLSYYKLIPATWGTLPDIYTRIIGYAQGINTTIQANPILAPILTVTGSLVTAGIVKWAANRSQAKIVSSLQNDNLQTQNSMTQSYSNSISNLQTQNQTLQQQVLGYQNQLSSMGDPNQLQSLLSQKQKEIETLRIEFQTLQNELTRQKIQVVPITVVK